MTKRVTPDRENPDPALPESSSTSEEPPPVDSTPSQEIRPARSWRDLIKPHPAPDLFPLMSSEELAELSEHVKANGVQNPVRPKDGGDLLLIDGRNRLDAAEAADVPVLGPDGKLLVPHEIVQEVDGFDPVSFVASKNSLRLHLSAQQKSAMAAKLLKKIAERSDREIGRIAKLDNKTVAAIRADLEGREEIPHVEARKDNKGRRQRKKRPRGGRPSPSPAPAAPRNDTSHGSEIAEIGEQLSETEVQDQITEVAALQPVDAELVKPVTPSPRADETDDLLTPIKQEWHKLTTEQQQEFLDWARASLECSPAKQPQPLPSVEAHDDVTVSNETRPQCKRRRGGGYSRCREEEGRCLDVRSTVEPPVTRESAASGSSDGLA
jgi:hypothetical protein